MFRHVRRFKLGGAAFEEEVVTSDCLTFASCTPPSQISVYYFISLLFCLSVTA